MPLLAAPDELVSGVRGLEDGADDHLTKTFDLSELVARTLRSATPSSGTQRHADRVLLSDPLAQRVQHGAVKAAR